MEQVSSHQIELDDVTLDIYGHYTAGSSGSYEDPPEADCFEIQGMFINYAGIEVDVTELLYYRTEEIEELILIKFYR